ncbi:MAG: anthranilate phosphoribosyltransferase, partial [Myxococcales bacterium]|nr:anthranilate phosphoribosyltransferase [Myxococcales bacterium]
AAEALAHASLTGQLPEAATAAWLTALQLKGLTAAELTGIAGAVRGLMVRTPLPGEGPVLDTGGTGGSGLDTLNTSTMAGLVCAAAGVRVARQVAPKGRGRCGAADVLAHLGVNLDLSPARAQALAEPHPFVVLPQATHHPALAALDPLRAAMGLPTVLDVVAPLCNPAGARHHLIGVADDRLGPLMIQALKTLGSRRAMVVHGTTGLDELALSSPTRYWELWDDGSIHKGVLTPEDLGLTRAPFFHMRGGGPAANAQRFVALLKGEDDSPAAEHVALNAGAALYVAGVAADLELGVARARSVLTTGAAYAVFDAWRAASHEVPDAAAP